MSETSQGYRPQHGLYPFNFMQKGIAMYPPKRGFEAGPEDKTEYFPMRELPDLDQTLIDTMITIDDDSSEKDLGYFVPMCNGVPWHWLSNEDVTQ